MFSMLVLSTFPQNYCTILTERSNLECEVALTDDPPLSLVFLFGSTILVSESVLSDIYYLEKDMGPFS